MNEEVIKMTGQGTLLQIIYKRRHQWLGHVLRMEKEHLPNTALEWKPENARRKRKTANNMETNSSERHQAPQHEMGRFGEKGS